MNRWVRIAAVVLGLLVGPATDANAQGGARLLMPPRPAVSATRLYILDCGALTNSSMTYFQMTVDEVANTLLANMCFLIVHPKGTLLWETGLPDRWVGRPVGENMSGKYVVQLKTRSLVGQLADIGYTPEMVDYLSLSHFHHDHAANSNLFARTATWLVSKPDWDLMFGSSTRPRGHEDFDMLKDAKTVLIGEIHDVFGDGAVLLRRAPGHTPGHSVLQVNLQNTGPVILAGDLWHYPEEITLDRVPKVEEATGTRESRRKILDLAKAVKGQVWITHDTALFLRASKAPAYYD